VLARPRVSRVVTAAIRPWAPKLSPGILLRVPVTRIVEVSSPLCSEPVWLDTGGVDPIASMLYWHGLSGWEPETLPVFLTLVSAGMTVIDVGANTGVFTLLAARRSPAVSVHAVEPVPRVYDLLRANVARNRASNVTSHRLALSDRAGVVPMYVPDDEIPVMASLLPEWRPGSDLIDVQACTLDQFVADQQLVGVDIIKIDTEGTTNTLASCKPFIFCEVLEAGDTAEGLTASMASAGYLFYQLSSAGPRPVERLVGNRIGSCHNYLFVPRSRLEQAQELLDLPLR